MIGLPYAAESMTIR